MKASIFRHIVFQLLLLCFMNSFFLPYMQVSISTTLPS
jgi:hypothetical protein